MKRNKKKNTKLVLLVLLICITVAYAVLRTGLNINGTANISSSSWNVHFENYQNSNSTNITPTTEPTITGTTTTTITYVVNLEQPGDLYEFTVDVVNSGSIDASISVVSNLGGSPIGTGNTVPEYIDYVVSDNNDQALVDGHRLNHGNSEVVKVKVAYKTDIDASQLPSTNQELSFSLVLTATQAEKEVAPADVGVFTIAGIRIGQTIPNNITTYSTPADAMAAFDNRPFYLKHTISRGDYWCITSNDYDSCLDANTSYSSSESCFTELNNSYDNNYTCTKKTGDIVKESYVGFVITDALKTQWKEGCSGDTECEAQIDNLVNGTYYLRGGVDESSLSTQPIYEANKSVIKQAFNYTVQPTICNDGSSYFDCGVSSSSDLTAYAYSNGKVFSHAGYEDDYCDTDSFGGSYCYTEWS